MYTIFFFLTTVHVLNVIFQSFFRVCITPLLVEVYSERAVLNVLPVDSISSLKIPLVFRGSQVKVLTCTVSDISLAVLIYSCTDKS